MKSYDVENKMRELVHQKARAYLVARGDMTRMAAKAGVSADTFRKLAYGETKHPRFHTVVAVLYAFGCELTVKETTPSLTVVPTVGKRK